MKKVFGLLALVAFALIWGGCKDKDKPALEYDRAALVRNISQNLIQRDYQLMDSWRTNLFYSTNYFLSSPTSSELNQLRVTFKLAWMTWQTVEVYEFGPAAQISYRASINTWPTDSAQIEANIAAGTWDLSLASNSDAKGFPAIDYLLNRADAQETLDLFTTDSHAPQRKQYLGDLVQEISALFDSVWGEWQQNYIATFEASLGTDVGSSTGFLVNQLSYELELTKNPRIGVPLGKLTLGQALPHQVEARYGGYSAELAKTNVEYLYRLWKGESPTSGNGYGFDDALDALEAKYDGEDLSNVIEAQFEAAISALQAIPDPLSNTIQVQPQLVETAYVAIQRLVVLLKTDMASALGILITYTDSDGD